MPLDGAKFYETSQGNAKAYYYLESLAGDYVLDHTDTGGSSGSKVTDEDRSPALPAIRQRAPKMETGTTVQNSIMTATDTRSSS